jgi:hypothetical protein
MPVGDMAAVMADMAVDMLSVAVPRTRRPVTSQAGHVLEEVARSTRAAHIAQAADTMQPAATMGLAGFMQRAGILVGLAVIMVGEAAITATDGQVTAITAWATAIPITGITDTTLGDIILTATDTGRP